MVKASRSSLTTVEAASEEESTRKGSMLITGGAADMFWLSGYGTVEMVKEWDRSIGKIQRQRIDTFF